MTTERYQFTNKSGATLSAYLDTPDPNDVRAYALFAHCFTCGKNLKSIKRINTTLAQYGIATLRFDFTGIGESEGDFSETSLSTNVDDLTTAADFLSTQFNAPSLLIGHSMGGVAILKAAGRIDSVEAVITIATPSSPEHLSHLLREKRNTALQEGSAEVTIGGRSFTLSKEFFHDLESHEMEKTVGNLGKPLLLLHSPEDQTVDIENADDLFHLANQPKNYISLEGAGHLMLEESDAVYVGKIIAAWADKYI